MSGRLKEAAMDEKVIEDILMEEEIEEMLDQHIREKEELKEENEDLKRQLEDLKKRLKSKE